MNFLMVLLLIVLGINIISFIGFAGRKFLDDSGLGGFDGMLDDLVMLLAIGGAIGAFIGMRVNSNGIEYDPVFKIVIPIGMIIQVATITYLALFEMGIVK